MLVGDREGEEVRGVERGECEGRNREGKMLPECASEGE